MSRSPTERTRVSLLSLGTAKKGVALVSLGEGALLLEMRDEGRQISDESTGLESAAARRSEGRGVGEGDEVSAGPGQA